MATPFSLDFQPGVQRDGTRFDAKRAIDLLWTRFRLGRPRKIGGLQTIVDMLGGMPRKVHCWYDGNRVYAHIGTTNGITQVVFDSFGNYISSCDRTPVEFIGGSEVSFTMDALFDTTSQVVQLIVHNGQNSAFVSSPASTVPFLGQINSPAPLTQFSNPGVISSGVWTQPNISGGIVCVQPFVFDFDSNGLVQWSGPNLALYLGVVGGGTGAGQARISAQKVVQGMPLRGGGAAAPAAIFWTLSEVIIATYIGTPAYFSFSTVSPSSSILSGASAIEYDGLYFWAGIDRFLVFNGTVTELPNGQNQDWFFDNLTPGYECMTYAFKIPRYGEIWWCAAMFGSTVPNYAIIFNLRENAWYDTLMPIPAAGAAFFAQGFKRPLMAGQDTDGLYKLWMMETGTDLVDGSEIRAIRSYFESAIFGGPSGNPPDDRGMSIQQLEPDIIQTGEMSTYLVGAPNARAAEHTGPVVPLVETPDGWQEEFPSYTPTQSQRLTRIHVESNVIGGSYISGKNLMRGEAAEKRKNS